MVTIVLVGDVVGPSTAPVRSLFDHDNPHEEEVEALTGWLCEAGYRVLVKPSIRDFVEHPPDTADTLVLPLWRGGASRNRTAIVPAVCEERNLPYIGGDAFVQCVCQNKSLSKAWARAAGFVVPSEYVFYSPTEIKDFQPVSRLGSPCVLKPLFSACSIGVTDASLSRSDAAAAARAIQLFAEGLGPVLCEEFVPGDEVAICVVEQEGQITKHCLVGYRDAADKCPFHSRLFTFADKIDENPPWELSILTTPLESGLWESAETLIRRLGKVDLLRLDGRISNGRFVLIELTPDIHLSLSSSFLGGFSALGIPPPDILDQIIRTSLQNQGRDAAPRN